MSLAVMTTRGGGAIPRASTGPHYPWQATPAPAAAAACGVAGKALRVTRATQVHRERSRHHHHGRSDAPCATSLRQATKRSVRSSSQSRPVSVVQRPDSAHCDPLRRPACGSRWGWTFRFLHKMNDPKPILPLLAIALLHAACGSGAGGGATNDASNATASVVVPQTTAVASDGVEVATMEITLRDPSGAPMPVAPSRCPAAG